MGNGSATPRLTNIVARSASKGTMHHATRFGFANMSGALAHPEVIATRRVAARRNSTYFTTARA